MIANEVADCASRSRIEPRAVREAFFARMLQRCAQDAGGVIRSKIAFRTLAALLLLLAIAVVLRLSLPGSVTTAFDAASVPPQIESGKYLPLSAEQAISINSQTVDPVDIGPPAQPFRITGSGYAAALDCLAQAVYYEAAIDGPAGERAVAQVILNRVRHPAFPSSICGVVFQGAERPTGCQFTFTCDGALTRRPYGGEWAQANAVARAALAGYVFAPVGLATHYHANTVVPYWAASLSKANIIGTQLFYRWKGSWGTPAAFRQQYSQRELDPSSKIGRWLAQNDENLPDSDKGENQSADSLLSGNPDQAFYLIQDKIRDAALPFKGNQNLEADRDRPKLILDDPANRVTLLLDENPAHPKI